MSRKLTLAEASAFFRNAAVKLKRNVETAESESLADLREEAVKASSGNVKLYEMRRKALDHPYARRHGSPKLDPEIVNIQSGLFRLRWTVRALRIINGALTGALVNTDSVAPYLDQPDGGPNSKMFARHPQDRAARIVRPRRTFRFVKAVQAAFT